MEKSVSFWWRKTGAKDRALIAELDDKSRDFLKLIESTTEPTDLKLYLSIKSLFNDWTTMQPQILFIHRQLSINKQKSGPTIVWQRS